MKHSNCVKIITLLICPDCLRVKRSGKWMKLTDNDREELDDRIKQGADYKVILVPCGCLEKK